MSFQFDIEEWVENVESVAGDAALISHVFVPIIPVTLALRWSPFLVALRTRDSRAYLGSVRAVFTSLPTFDVGSGTADEQPFTSLLRAACARAAEANELVLLVARQAGCMVAWTT